MKKHIVKAATAVSALVVSGAVMAQEGALPSWASDIATEAESTGSAAAAMIGPVIGGVLVSLIAIKLIKRFANRI